MFKITNLDNYYKHYTQSDTLSLSNAPKHFSKKYIKIYDIDPCYFLSATVLSWIALSQKSFSKDY